MNGWKRRVLVALLLPWAAQAQKPQPTYEMEVKGEIAIGPDGAVSDYKLKGRLHPAIAAVVDKRVRAWTFEPILVDGKPVIATTRMRLALSATPAEGDRYALQVQNVSFGEPERVGALPPPRYPAEAARASVGGKVVLLLRIDAQGNVVDVWPEQTSLTPNGDAHGADKWRRKFEAVTMAAARHWKFNAGERFDGEAMDSVARVPVSYDMYGGSNAHWNAFVPGPIRPAPWARADQSTVAGRARLRDGEAQSLSSRFRLRENIIGTTL